MRDWGLFAEVLGGLLVLYALYTAVKWIRRRSKRREKREE